MGTPYCLTIDFDTLEDGTVTLRDRDTLKQERLTLAQVEEIIRSKVSMAKLLEGLNL
ncbi:MAG: His/Gly/Thr/Pro-type tRNA ligase C-terminal domain-containing protein [bacterium]